VKDERLVSELRAAARRAEARRSGTRPTPLSLGVVFQERATGLILAELSLARPALIDAKGENAGVLPARWPLVVSPPSRARSSALLAFFLFAALGAVAAIVLAARTWGP
jgi:hypothetical protein